MSPVVSHCARRWTEDDFGRDVVALMPRLRRVALSLTRSGHCADDLVQDACERAFAASAGWTPGTRLDAWMICILRNLWFDTLRRRRRERPVAHDEVVAVDGERELEARLTLEWIRSAIADLPRENREVLVLVCIEELSYSAAAERLGIPIGTVMSRLSRARIRLAARMSDRPRRSRAGTSSRMGAQGGRS